MSKDRSWQRKSGDLTLLGAQFLISVFRTVFRLEENFANPRRKARLRQFRESMAEMERARDEALAAIRVDPLKGMEATDAMRERFGSLLSEEEREARQRLRAMHEEGETLKRISEEAANDEERTQRFRQYVNEHPDSRLGWIRLGWTLQTQGDWDGSLAAYRKAESLTRHNLTSNSMVRFRAAEVLAARGDRKEAISEFRALIAQSGESEVSVMIGVRASLYLGDALREEGDIVGARKAWREAGKVKLSDGELRNEVQKRLKETP